MKNKGCMSCKYAVRNYHSENVFCEHPSNTVSKIKFDVIRGRTEQKIAVHCVEHLNSDCECLLFEDCSLMRKIITWLMSSAK